MNNKKTKITLDEIKHHNDQLIIEDKSQQEISRYSAEKLAIELGATYVASYSPELNYGGTPYIMFDHYFNNNDREIGFYHITLESFNDTRMWNNESNIVGREWGKNFINKLINKRNLTQ